MGGLVDGLEIEGVDTALGIDADGDEAGFAEDFEVLGDCGGGDGEVGLEFAGGFGPVFEEFDHAPPVGVGEGGKGVHGGIIFSSRLIKQGVEEFSRCLSNGFRGLGGLVLGNLELICPALTILISALARSPE